MTIFRTLVFYLLACVWERGKLLGQVGKERLLCDDGKGCRRDWALVLPSFSCGRQIENWLDVMWPHPAKAPEGDNSEWKGLRADLLSSGLLELNFTKEPSLLFTILCSLPEVPHDEGDHLRFGSFWLSFPVSSVEQKNSCLYNATKLLMWLVFFCYPVGHFGRLEGSLVGRKETLRLTQKTSDWVLLCGLNNSLSFNDPSDIMRKMRANETCPLWRVLVAGNVSCQQEMLEA